MAERNAAPRARTDGLLTQQIGDEMLIYDRVSHEGHSLDSTAVRLWRACDGQTTIDELARSLGLDRDDVEEALTVLSERGLMADELDGPRLSRRAAIRGGLVAGGAMAIGAPVIRSIVAPSAAQAGTAACKPNGELCESNAECCSGNCFLYDPPMGVCE